MSFGRVIVDELVGWLSVCARTGHPCPTDKEIAAQLGFASSATAVRLIAELEKRRLIMVERVAGMRVVTIVATGARTARPADAVPPSGGIDNGQAAGVRLQGREVPDGKPELGVRPDSPSSPERGSDRSRPAVGPTTATKPAATSTPPAAEHIGVAERARREAEEAVEQRRRARAGSIAKPLRRDPVTIIAQAMAPDINSGVALIRKQWPGLWDRVIATARANDQLPGAMLVRAIEAGLDEITGGANG